MIMDIKDMQRRLGVAQDGIVGPATLTAIYAAQGWLDDPDHSMSAQEPKDTLDLMRAVASPRAHLATLLSMAGAFDQNKATYKMVTNDRIAEFLAQIANETGGFQVFSENLNYSAEGLVKTWPSRFTLATAQSYARQPEKIANKVYADRMGNGPPESGDGWRYRGRGALQLTGRAAYRAAGQRLGLPLEDQPDLAADPATSVLIALDFWRENAVNTPIDAGDFRKARKITNGGLIGLEEVARLRGKLLAVMS